MYLFIAAARGDVDFFKTVAPEILLEARNISSETVLGVAAINGRLDCCEVIVHRCPPLLYDQSDQEKCSVLHNVLYSVSSRNNLEMIRFLITADSKTDLELGRGGKIPNKRLLTMQTSRGHTALHIAVGEGNHEVTKLLLEADCDFELLRMVDGDGLTCLHIATLGNDLLAVELIIKAKPDNEYLKMQNPCIGTALHIAAELGFLSIAELLLRTCHELLGVVNIYQETALHYAVEKRNLDMVKLMSKDKNFLSMADSEENTPLHLAMDKAAHDGSHSDSELICKLLLEKDPSQCTKRMGDTGWMPLHHAVSYGLSSVAKHIIQLFPDCTKAEDFGGQTPYMLAMGRVLSDENGDCSNSDLEIIHMLLEKNPEQCKIQTGEMKWTYLHHATSKGQITLMEDILKLCPNCQKIVDGHNQTFIHIAVKLGLLEVVKSIMKLKEIESTILDAQDNDGNTALHIAALSKNKEMTLCLLYDDRVSKGIENAKKEKAIDLINFPYNEAKAKVYSIGHQRDLKDQSSFDLLVAALIATVSFTAGITVPGGYVSDGRNKGSAILLKATAFKVFVVSNNFALLFSLYTVFLNFSTRRILKEEDIYYESSLATFRTRLLLKKKDMIYQLNTATLCTLSAVYAMVVAFITGSYAVLANSDGLAITVCVSSCVFLTLASHATWTMAMEYWHVRPVTEISSSASPEIWNVQPGVLSSHLQDKNTLK